MMCWLEISILGALLLGVPHAPKDHKAMTHAAANSGESTNRIVSPTHVVVDPPLPTNEEKPLTKFTRPEWLIVYITAVYVFISGWTLLAIKRQGDIAKATLVSTFRPSVVIGSVKLNPSNYANYMAIGDGVWKVELTLVNKGSTGATVEKCAFNVGMFNDKKPPQLAEVVPIGSMEWPAFKMPPADRHQLEFVIPRESMFAGSFALQVQMLNMANNHGQAVWPTCYGTIIYLDENGHKRQTGFSRRWNIPGERFEVSSDPEVEYQD